MPHLANFSAPWIQIDYPTFHIVYCFTFLPASRRNEFAVKDELDTVQLPFEVLFKWILDWNKKLPYLYAVSRVVSQFVSKVGTHWGLRMWCKNHCSHKNHCNDNCNDFSNYYEIVAPLDRLIMTLSPCRQGCNNVTLHSFFPDGVVSHNKNHVMMFFFTPSLHVLVIFHRHHHCMVISKMIMMMSMMMEWW